MLSVLLLLGFVGVFGAPRTALTATLPLPNNSSAYDRQIALLALQGLANRAAPRLFFDTPVFWSSPSSQIWLRDNYLTQLGFSFLPVSPPAGSGALLCGILDELPAGTVTGVTLYDAEYLEGTRWLAVTAGALDAALPVTRAMLADPLLQCLQQMPVVADFSRGAGNATDSVGLMGWALNALRPACDATSAYSGGHTYTDSAETVNLGGDPAIDIGLDTAVSKKLFTFNLSPDTSKYPAHAIMWERIVASLTGAPNAVPNLLGWAEPEPAMTMSTSKAGGSVVCDGAPNLSFWAALGGAAAQLPYHLSGEKFDASACYISVMSNEGDTPKIAAALQQDAWRDPRRGSVPVAWGINPLVFDIAPGLMQYYAQTALANDTFFAATAGAGYSYPWSMPNMTNYVRRAAQLVEQLTSEWPSDAWHVDVWDSNVLGNVSTYAAISADAGLRLGSFSMQPESMAGFSGSLPDGTPIVIPETNLWYPSLNANDPLGDLQARVAFTCAQGPRPRFSVVYGNLRDAFNLSVIDYALAIQRLPAANNVRLVGMQDFTALARQASAASAKQDDTD